MAERLPVPDGFWPFLREFRERLRAEGVRLTYPQIGGALGLSAGRVKQLLNDYEQVKTPDGWRMRTRRDSDVVDGFEGADEGVGG